MKRKHPIRKQSSKGKLIARIEKLLREILILERGAKCEISGRTTNLGLFHILSKGIFPRLRFARENLLIVSWLPTHFHYHHLTDGDPRYERIKNRIIELRGADYVMDLKKLDVTLPRLTMTYLHTLEEAYKIQLNYLKKGGK